MRLFQLYRLRFVSSVALGLLIAATAAATVIRVPADQPTIQAAIDAAVDGDVVVVSPGTYQELIDFHGKAITVHSANGASKTIIDGNNAGTVVTFDTGETSKSVLSGFTIRGGAGTFGAGINLLGASPTITNNMFLSNNEGSGGYGAAIGGNVASPIIQSNFFSRNTCDTQFLSGVVSFINSSSPLVMDNIFSNNPCRAINMTLPEDAAPVVAFNTIVRNSVGVRVDARVPASSQLYLNNIVVANDMGLEADFLNAGNEPTWTNNDVFGNSTNYFGIDDQTGLNANISSNPQFVNPNAQNYQLQPSSPAIDAGTLSVPHIPKRDFAGNPRVLDGNGDGTALPDMGAYEFVPR